MKQKHDHLNPEIKFLLYCVDSNYREMMLHFPVEVVKEIGWMRLLRKAAENRVLYVFSKKMMENHEIPKTHQLTRALEEIVETGDGWFDRFRGTMGFIETVSEENGIPFLVIKTYKRTPYVASDIDILVRTKEEFYQINDALRDEGAVLEEKEVGKAFCVKTGLIGLGVHWGISWNGMTYVDNELLWKGKRRVKVYGVECDVPAPDADLLLSSAHILSELYCITLGDFIHLSSLLQENLDWKIIREQTEKHAWNRSFQHLLSIAGSMYNKIYSEPLFQGDYSNTFSEFSLDFPYMYSPKDVLGHFWEKIHGEAQEKRSEETLDFLRWLSFYGYRLLRRHFPRRLCFSDAFGGCNIPISLES